MATSKSKNNLRSPGVKRLMREAIELAEPTEEYYACPLEGNLFEWHFTVKGPPGTEFEDGLYHGKIQLPTQYPMQPPNIILLTPNGRFEVNKKICLSISGFHPESWQPSWSIRTVLLALIAFMPTTAAGTVGSLDYSPEERRILARKSRNFECQICGPIIKNLSSKKGIDLITEGFVDVEQIALEEGNGSSKLQAQEEDEDAMKEILEIFHESKSHIMQEDLEPLLSEHDSLLEASIRSSNRDKMWSAVIWAIISTITLLLIRRFFFI